MDKENRNNLPTTSAGNEKEKNGDSKKYNFYRKPSMKKKPPEVKQTLTSYKRMLKANPLLKYAEESKELPHNLVSSSNNNTQADYAPKNLKSEKPSLQPNFNAGKPLVSNLQRSKSVKNPPKPMPKPLAKTGSTIISGNRPQPATARTKSIDISKQSSVDFNTSTSRFLSSTKLESACKVQKKKETVIKPSSSTTARTRVTKTASSTQDNSVLSSRKPADRGCREREKKTKPARRSLSAQHFDRKKGVAQIEPQKCFNRTELAQSLDDISALKPTTLQQPITPIAEGSRETSVTFKTPSAYERRSVARFTPWSTTSISRRSVYQPVTPLPSLNDLQKRLNEWLIKRGKNPRAFHHLKCFGVQENGQVSEPVDEENKENIEVDQDLNKGSYEDLKITNGEGNHDDNAESESKQPVVLNEENAERVAKAALDDLLKLIHEGYPRPQCEGWLELIRQKYRNIEEEPQYWECRAAIEQSRGNISSAVDCYKTAIVQGAEVQAVDESLDILLQKFSLLNISMDKSESPHELSRERARILRDARNVFKSSIIQFAVQERKLKKTIKEEIQTKLVATPVRRSTRLSRTCFTSTPGVKVCSTLEELGTPDRNNLEFKKNKALV